MYGEGEVKVARGVGIEDFLVVWDQDSRYLGFDLTQTPPRCLSWHPREKARKVSNIVEEIDDLLSQQIEELVE